MMAYCHTAVTGITSVNCSFGHLRNYYFYNKDFHWGWGQVNTLTKNCMNDYCLIKFKKNTKTSTVLLTQLPLRLSGFTKSNGLFNNLCLESVFV